jgi:arsenate reductase
MTLRARSGTVADAEAVARIYNQAIEDRGANFETHPRAAAEVGVWFEGTLPFIVIEDDGRAVAFATSFQWRQHERFKGIAELAVYVAREARGRGAGRLALEELALACERAGFWKLLGGVFAGNTASRRLLRAAGFREVGTYEKQARLEGAWVDVVMFEKLIPANLEPPATVIFACVHNAGRSQMAAAFFNELADAARVRAVSAGTQPGARVHPVVLEAMSEVGIDLSSAKPRKLSAELASGASLLITMGCGDECPVVPGLQRDDWPLADPKDQPLARVREIRAEVRARVLSLLEARGWVRRT